MTLAQDFTNIGTLFARHAATIRTAPPPPPPRVTVPRSPLNAKAPARVLLAQLRRKEWGPVFADQWRVVTAILAELQSVVDHAGRAVLTEAEMAGRTGYSIRHIQRGKARLVELDLLRFTPGSVNPADGRRRPSVWQVVRLGIYAAWQAARGGFDAVVAARRAAAAARTRHLWGKPPSHHVHDIASSPPLPVGGMGPPGDAAAGAAAGAALCRAQIRPLKRAMP